MGLSILPNVTQHDTTREHVVFRDMIKQKVWHQWLAPKCTSTVSYFKIYQMFNNDCTPSTAQTCKTLAKLSLYYNSLNKLTLLWKVSDWCVLFSLKKLQITYLQPAMFCKSCAVTCMMTRRRVWAIDIFCTVLLTLWFLSLNNWKHRSKCLSWRSSESQRRTLSHSPGNGGCFPHGTWCWSCIYH